MIFNHLLSVTLYHTTPEKAIPFSRKAPSKITVIINRNLEEFDIKVTDAICDQTDLLMENNKEYQIAVETGNLVEVGSIGNMLRENAKEIVYEDTVYV